MEEKQSEFTAVEVVQDKTNIFVGLIVELLNEKHWRFFCAENEEHPGACIEYNADTRVVNTVKGTSKRPRDKYIDSYVDVLPDDNNGLDELTYFSIDLNELRQFRQRTIELAMRDRTRGRLSDIDLGRIRDAFAEFLPGKASHG